MRNVWTIAKREYKLYFNSPMAYLMAFVLFLITGIYFVLVMYIAQQGAYSQGGTAPGTNFVVNVMSFIFLFILPGVTMRLIAGENQSGMLEMLLTVPIRDWELVVGKWLGSFLFILTLIAGTLIYPLILNKLVTPGIDQGLMMANYVAIILVAAAFLAIGTGVSSIFNNQFAAFFTTLAVLLLFWWVFGWIGSVTQSSGGVFTYLSLSDHFTSLLQGKVALSDAIYFLSVTAFGLFLGTMVVEIRRWI